VRSSDGHGADAYSVEAGGASAFAFTRFEPEGVAIIKVGLGGPEASIVLQNFSEEAVSLAG